MTDKPLLDLRNLTTVFPTRRGEVRAVDGVQLTLAEGEILGIVGESGCGKSTALLSIMRLIRPPGRIAAGQILFRGRDLSALSDSEMRAVRGREIQAAHRPSSAWKTNYFRSIVVRLFLSLEDFFAIKTIKYPLF